VHEDGSLRSEVWE